MADALTGPFDDIVQRNAEFAAAFDTADAPKVPTDHLVVLTCMDARVDTWRAFGIEAGTAHVLRNAGGRASEDAIRSIAVSTAALDTNRVAIIHHTDCGMKGEEAAVRSAVADRTGRDPGQAAFLTFTDDEQAVRDDVDVVRNSPLVADDVDVAGFLFDVTDGRLVRVV